jgi:hypothetical protein
MPYTIEYASSVAGELAALRAFDRSKILDEIDVHLVHQPNVPTGAGSRSQTDAPLGARCSRVGVTNR